MTNKEREEAITTIKRLDHDFGDYEPNHKVFENILSALKGGWIPVTERLPEEGKDVLFCDIDNDIMLGYHLTYAPATHFIDKSTWDDVKNVRAWMELPEPYKADSEE